VQNEKGLGAEWFITDYFYFTRIDGKAIAKRNINEKWDWKVSDEHNDSTCPNVGLALRLALMNPEFQKCDRCGVNWNFKR